MDVIIVDRPELRVAGIRHIGRYMDIGREFGRLGGMVKGPLPSGAQMIAIYYDDPDATPVDQLRSDAAITLPERTASPLGLIEHRVAAGRYAMATHRGSYRDLPEAWTTIKQWTRNNGHIPANPSYEIYLNTPVDTPEADLLTELYLRIG